jgi:hypothetical protein
MSRTSILAIFAGAGVIFLGAATLDAVALARAIQSDDVVQLQRFSKDFPDSQYKSDAERIAKACITNWVNGACGLTSPGRGNGGGGGGVHTPPVPNPVFGVPYSGEPS